MSASAVQFRKKCPQDWERLERTAENGTRFCAVCDRAVFFCATDEETMFHAERGDCIAREVPDTSEFPRLVLGEPDPESIRRNRLTRKQNEAVRIATREEAIARALDDMRYSDRRCLECGYPVASWLRSCRVCGSSEFRDAEKP